MARAMEECLYGDVDDLDNPDFVRPHKLYEPVNDPNVTEVRFARSPLRPVHSSPPARAILSTTFIPRCRACRPELLLSMQPLLADAPRGGGGYRHSGSAVTLTELRLRQ